MEAFDVDTMAVDAAEEAEEEEMDAAAVQDAVEAEREEEYKISHNSHSTSKTENRHRHNPILKRDQEEAVYTVRTTTTSASVLIPHHIKITVVYPNLGGGGKWQWWR